MEQLLLRDVEFFVLLKAAGINYIPYFETSMEYGKTEVPYAIHEMARKGILSLEEDGRLQVNTPYLQIIKAIKEYKGILMLQSGEEKKNTKYIFLSDVWVLVQDNKNMDNGILVEEVSIEELQELVDDIIPSGDVLDCLEDLEFVIPDEDTGICDLCITLGRKYENSTIKECVKWEFFRGRYQPYVRESELGMIRKLSRREWNAEILLTRINALREEKNNDNG